MGEPTSPYYPPRAGWNRHFYHAAYAVRRQLHLEDLNLPELAIDISAWKTFLCLLVPGFSFAHAGWKWLGRGMLAAWFAAGVVFLAWLGYTTANVAFALMMSVHVSSILHFVNRVSPGMSVLRRLGLSLGILLVVGQLLYATGLRGLQNRCFMPLQSGGKVYIINRLSSVSALRRGEFVAFHSERIGSGNIWIREGYVLDRILAEPQDHVEFTPKGFRVNGVAAARLPLMLADGSLVVPEKTWLVWPTLDTVTRYNASESEIGNTVLRMAQVHREQVIGKPFRRWFWREQTK
jgi:hypothetical protein